VAGGVIALADVDAVGAAALERLVQRDRRALELLQDAAQPLQPRLQLEVVVGRGLGDRRDYRYVVALGADGVRRGDERDVDV